MTREMLRRHGYTVIEAADAKEALTAAMRHSIIDLLLTDVVLPGMSGPELARQFHRDWPEVSVLFMSGYTAGTMGQQETLDPLILKPFSVEVLLRNVREVLDRRSSG